ncbi:MAG: hypothetical protein EB060_04300 [Proteobacteria bacterium]|nr:hypothetical protein [Pseudomonadota bacterium]
MVETPRISNTTSVTPTNTARTVPAQVPQAIASLPAGTVLNALVLKNDKNGNVVISTTQGAFTVSSPIPLKEGATLQLRVYLNQPVTGGSNSLTSAQHFQAQILSIDGKPAPLPTQNPNPTAATTQPQPNTNPPTSQVLVATDPATGKPAPIITAVNQQGQQTLVDNAAKASVNTVVPAAATVVRVTGGATLRAVLISPAPDAENFLPPATTPALSAAAKQAAAVYGNTNAGNPAAQTQAQPLLKGGDVLVLRVASPPTLPGAAPTVSPTTTTTTLLTAAQTTTQTATPTTVLPQNTFIATVIGTEASGEAVLQTPLGTIKLLAQNELPNGAKLTLEIVKLQAGEAPLATAAQDTDAFLPPPLDSDLTELATLVKTQGSAAQQAALDRILPQANDPQFAAKLLWFLTGVQQGDATQWMGAQLTRFLEQNDKVGLIQKIQKDFGRLKQVSTEGVSQWNTMFFPVLNGNTIEHGAMFTRHYPADQDGNQEDGTRFIVEVDYSTLGMVQLDGFVKNKTGKKAFDLFLRSKEALPDEARSDISSIFSTALEIGGFTGALQFQQVKEFPVDPLVDIKEFQAKGAGDIVA